MNITRLTELRTNCAFERRIDDDIHRALNSVRTIDDKFIVNDNSSRWFKPPSDGRMTPCVMNEARFISGQFQRCLEDLGWTKEKKLNEQTIDAYVTIPSGMFATYGLTRESLLSMLGPLWQANPDANAADLMSTLYYGYYRRRTPYLTGFDALFHRYFDLQQEPVEPQVRVGLEFETGNIASSFRALTKLDGLFCGGTIDIGIFITVHDRRSAYQIWPPSNRNGTFEELRNRGYKAGLRVPLIEYSFRPDDTSPDAPYLRSDGSQFRPIPTGRTKDHNGVTYIEYQTYGNSKAYLRI